MNRRPSGYEPDELPDCSIPRYFILLFYSFLILTHHFCVVNTIYYFYYKICKKRKPPAETNKACLFGGNICDKFYKDSFARIKIRAKSSEELNIL